MTSSDFHSQDYFSRMESRNSEMDLVNLFNSEVKRFATQKSFRCSNVLYSISIFQLSSLYEVKPPISKGKMTAITKSALKAVKLYKHVVQSVEKFIQKV